MSNNVLQLIGSFNQGGSERQAVQLTRLLRESNRFNISVATLDGSGPLRTEIEGLGFSKISEYPLTSFYDRNATTQLRRFVRQLRQDKIEVVHTHDFYTNIFGMAAASLAGVPVRIASRRESALRPAKHRLVERTAFRLAHQVVANCEEVRQQLIAEGVPAKKITTLYNGLDLSRISPGKDINRKETLALLGLPTSDARRFITIVANMRAHFMQPRPICLKDHPTFLRAAKRVRQEVSDAAFIIAGEGELLEETRLLVRELGLDQVVFFLGRCENVARLLAISYACVLSSTAEGFSNSILEYMAAGRPVVATDVGGAREAVLEGETGHLVTSGDDEQMAARLIELLRKPDVAQLMGERGRQVIIEKFSSEAQLARTQNLYDRLLASEPRRSIKTVASVRSNDA